MLIKVLLADDHQIIREGLRSLVNREPDMEVVAEADNGRMAVQLNEKRAPDVVIMDINMPDLNGMEATRQIVSTTPNVKIVALSMLSDHRFITGMIKAGASGYLLKDCAFKELSQAIRTVAEGKIYLSPAISGAIREFVSELPETASVSVELTAREREVIQLIAEGKSTKEIADILHVSVKTIETHRQNVMKKLRISSVAELTKYAIREGLTSI